jgi:AraC-like DNA-binding protein
LGLGSNAAETGSAAEALPAELRSSADREVRVGPFMPLVPVLAQAGVPLAEVLAAAGVPAGLFSSAEDRVSDEGLCRVFAIAAERLGMPHVGLVVGRHRPTPDLGAVGELGSLCATVGAALRTLISHLHLNNRAGVPVMLEYGPGNVILGYSIYRLMKAPTRQVLDVAVTTTFALVEHMCGPAWRPVEVRFAYDEPEDLRPYQEVFGCRVRFNAELTGVVFPAALLALPLPRANAERHAQLEAQIRAARSRSGMSFAEQVRAVLPQAILGGASAEAEVAEVFAMHERTLRRRLLAEGAHFHDLLAGARRELAMQLLANTRLGVGDIARALGYADPNVFSRAFRGWAGVSPTIWREGQVTVSPPASVAGS